jgi:hypothetical protein
MADCRRVFEQCMAGAAPAETKTAAGDRRCRL